jgi:hypothetical protein
MAYFGKRPAWGLMAGCMLVTLLAGVSTSAGARVANPDEVAASIKVAEPNHRTVSRLVGKAKQGSVSDTRRLGELGEAGFDPLLDVLKNAKQGSVRFWAGKAMRKLEPQPKQAFRQAYHQAEAPDRANLALAAKAILGREAIELLKPDADANNPALRIRACGTLLQLTGDQQKYLPAIRRAAEKNNNTWHVKIAVEKLGDLANPLVPALAKKARGNGQAADSARQMLVKINTLRAWDVLQPHWQKQLREADKKQRVQRLVTIGQAGPPAAPMLPILRHLFQDQQAPTLVRAYARWALAQVRYESDAKPRTFHVAKQASNAGDDNPGTEQKPWRTIQKAAETMRPGDTVIVHEGIYREWVRPFVGGRAGEPITYKAAEGEDVVISGADLWRPDWHRVEQASNQRVSVYETTVDRLSWDWPEDWPKELEDPITARVEQLAIDGKRLPKFGDKSALTQKPMRCWYAMKQENPETIRISLPAGSTPSDHRIERSVRKENFSPVPRGLGYIHVKGFEMVRAAPSFVAGYNVDKVPYASALNPHRGHHWRIEDNYIHSSSTAGLGFGRGYAGLINDKIYTAPRVANTIGNHDVFNNRCNDNGTIGIGSRGPACDDLRLVGNTTNHNVWQGRLTDYESAGIKIMMAENVLLAHHTSKHNDAAGIWFDWMNERCRITRSTVVDNTVWGIFTEGGWGPVMVDHNVVVGTRKGELKWAAGIYGHDSSGVTTFNNVSLGHEGFAINYRFHRGKVMNGEKSQSSSLRIFNNVVDNAGRGWTAVVPPEKRSQHNKIDHNLYIVSDGEGQFGFLVPGGRGRLKAARKKYNLPGAVASQQIAVRDWRRKLKRDAHSVVKPAASVGLPRNADDAELVRWGERMCDRLAKQVDGSVAKLHKLSWRNRFLYDIKPRPIKDLTQAIASRWFNGKTWQDQVDLGRDAFAWRWRDQGQDYWLAWRAEPANTASWSPGKPWTRRNDLASKHTNWASPFVWQTSAASAADDALDYRSLIIQPGQRLDLPTGLTGPALTPPGFEMQTTNKRPAVLVPKDIRQRRYAMLATNTDTGRIHVINLENRAAVRVQQVRAAWPKSGPRINITLANRARQPVDTKLRLNIADTTVKRRLTLSPKSTQPVTVPCNHADQLVKTKLTVNASGQPPISQQHTLSFIIARRSQGTPTIDGKLNDWENVQWHAFSQYPNHIYPSGAEVGRMLGSALKARFAARFDDRMLYILLQAHDPKHQQPRSARKAWKSDSAQVIFTKVNQEGQAIADQMQEWLVSLKNGKTRKAGLTRSNAVNARFAVTRVGKKTCYEMAIPRDAIQSKAQQAKAMSPIAACLQINNHDGNNPVGLRWFEAIYGDHRHDPAYLGRLWLNQNNRSF